MRAVQSYWYNNGPCTRKEGLHSSLGTGMPIQTMHSETGEGAAPTAPVGVRVPVAWSMLKA